MAGLFWLPYHKKIPCKLKQRNSWTEEKQFHQPLSGNCQQQHPRRRLIFSCSKRLIVCRFVIADLIYFWFTIRFPCLKSAYTYASLTIKLPLLCKTRKKTRKNSRFINCFYNIARVLALYKSLSCYEQNLYLRTPE